jgi:uncharacterized protein YutE (UPF0331/DUF86 family)
MDKQLLEAKLNQLLHILAETEGWIAVSAEDFSKDVKLVRACQRNLQLLVEYASDINGILVLESGKKAPGSYKESFTVAFAMDFAANIPEVVRAALLSSVDWRNNLVHEYEPGESNEIFYEKLKTFLTAYRAYARATNQNFNPSA